jgi:hypothetical protein
MGPAGLESDRLAFGDVLRRDLQPFPDDLVGWLDAHRFRQPDELGRMHAEDGVGMYDLFRLPDHVESLVVQLVITLRAVYAHAHFARGFPQRASPEDALQKLGDPGAEALLPLGRKKTDAQPDGVRAHRMKLVKTRGSGAGGLTPARFPASMHVRRYAMFLPSTRMVFKPSSSFWTSAGSLPCTMFQ